MLFDKASWPGLADGSITLTFRRWKRPQARTGGTYRTPAGVLHADDVRTIEPSEITEREAHAAGWTTAKEIRAFLDRSGEGTVYRVAFHLAGPDPRVTLRESITFTDAEWDALVGRLARLDRPEPWTLRTLRLIADHPSERAADLAVRDGRERDAFKIDVRKLKDLGLTESLTTGYRITPRGRVVAARLAH